MANVLDLRRRIRSVKNTRQITKAMKMVSAAKLRRAQERALSSRPYDQMLTAVLKSLVRRADLVDPETGSVAHPLLVAREEKNALVIIVSGDSGFAGAFNANILRAAQKQIFDLSGKGVDIVALGRKAQESFRRRYGVTEWQDPKPEDIGSGEHGEHPVGIFATDDRNLAAQKAHDIKVLGQPPAPLEKLTFDQIRRLVQRVIRMYERSEIDAVYLAFNEFKSVIAQRIVVEKILPIGRIGERGTHTGQELSEEELAKAGKAAQTAGVSLKAEDTSASDEEANRFGTANVDYIYEQPPAQLFADLLPRYIATRVYHAVLESIAAYHAARMTAMDSASNNASDMIDDLTLSMNRVRQAAITREIIEIVSGAAAL